MPFSKKSLFSILALLVFCFALRLTTLGTLALFDPSEGRYATIAQNMVLTGDWVTPTTFDEGQSSPFLAKPPLQFWLTALAYESFGMTEFASRLTSFCSLAFLALVTFVFGREFLSVRAGLVALFVLVSSVMGFFFTGSCITDPLLSAIIGGALLSYALACKYGLRSFWSYCLFGFFGLGLLCKGPIAIVLAGVVIVPWLVFQKDRLSLTKLPWLGGICTMLVIATPWYLMAERANPGFINYFLVHENFLRFVTRNHGDRYGSSHVHPYGMIWLMMAGACLPWTLLLPIALRKLGWKGTMDSLRENRWLLFAILWGAAPCVFFTVSRQVSLAYVFPGLPGFALASSAFIIRALEVAPLPLRRFLAWQRTIAIAACGVSLVLGAVLWMSLSATVLALAVLATFGILDALNRRDVTHDRHIANLALASTALVTTFSVINISFKQPIDDAMSSKELVEHVEVSTSHESDSVTFVGKVPQSAYFYSRENGIDGLKVAFAEEFNDAGNGLVATTKKRWRKMAEADRQRFEIECSLGDYVLLKERT